MATIMAHKCGTCGERLLNDAKAKRYDHSGTVLGIRSYDHDVTSVVPVVVATGV